MPRGDLRQRLQSALVPAMRARDTTTVSAIRAALASVANAEAVPVEQRRAPLTEGPVAGTVGVGASEAARRELTEDDVRSLLRAEVEGYLEAATELDAAGQEGGAADLRARAAALQPFLDAD